MEQALPEEVVLEQEEAWAEAAAEAEWEAAKRVQGPEDSVYVLPAALLLLTRQDCPAIKSSALNAALQW